MSAMRMKTTLSTLVIFLAGQATAQAPPDTDWSGIVPKLSFILDVAGAYYTSDPHEGGEHDPEGTGFTLQQLEMHATSRVDRIFKLDLNVVFGHGGVEIEEAVASTLDLPGGLQFRLGQFLTRFGRLNATHPHTLAFADQSLLRSHFFGGEGSLGLGGEASWVPGLPWHLELVASINNATGECCARRFYGDAEQEIDGLEDFLYTVAIKQGFELHDDWSLRFGLSGQFGPNATAEGNRTEIYGADLELRFSPYEAALQTLALRAEGMFRTGQVQGGRDQDFGVHVEVVTDLTLQWQVGGRYEYLSGLLDAPETSVEDAERHRASLQLTYSPSHFSRIRLQGNHDRSSFAGTDPIWAGILSVEFAIGAHRAHAF